jgi:hypothetical protein
VIRARYAAPVVLAVAAAPVLQQAVPPRGVVRAGEYRAAPAAAPLMSGEVYDAGAFPLSPVELRPGQGRDAVVAMCGVCHSLRYITMQPPLPPETWAATVRKMVEVHGAAIPEVVARQITSYLQGSYGAR